MSFDNLKKSMNQSTVILSSFCVLILITACGGGSSEKTTDINNAPEINITSPTNGTVVSEEEAITFSASATDQEDGNISANIEWRSNVDGILGTGATIQVQLSSGNHTISATVTDSNNQNANSSLSIEVNANVGMASITWTAPTQNTDDTELTNLTGFKIYYGEVESNLDVSITIDDSDAYAWVIEDLKPGTTYYFAVTAVNSQGIESAFSSIASKFIPG